MTKLVAEIKKIKEIEAPKWAAFVKTSAAKERPPMQDDWWHIRVASILKKINKYGPIGANRLSRKYSSRKNRGHKPDIRVTGSRNIARKSLQQLEKAGLIRQVSVPYSGKILTKEGKELLKRAE